MVLLIFIALGALAVIALGLLIIAICWLEDHITLAPASVAVILLLYIALRLH